MDDPFLEAQRQVWTVGDYPAIARLLRPIAVECVAAAGVGPGDRVLDVGVGDGNAAIEAARTGATVTGIDLTPAQVERARVRCRAEGFDVELQVGDAQHLDVPDGSFDVVVSVMAVIFAPDHGRAAAELARACRPGGRVAMTAWATEGWSVSWRRRLAPLLPPPPPGTPSPDEWGDPAELVRRLAAAGLDAAVEQRPFRWRFPSRQVAYDVLAASAGPIVLARQAAAGLGRGDEFDAALAESIAEHDAGTGGECVLDAPYLLAMARPASTSR